MKETNTTPEETLKRKIRQTFNFYKHSGLPETEAHQHVYDNCIQHASIKVAEAIKENDTFNTIEIKRAKILLQSCEIALTNRDIVIENQKQQLDKMAKALSEIERRSYTGMINEIAKTVLTNYKEEK